MAWGRRDANGHQILWAISYAKKKEEAIKKGAEENFRRANYLEDHFRFGSEADNEGTLYFEQKRRSSK